MRSSRSSALASLLPIARRGIPFSSSDGEVFVRLPHPFSGGYFILPVRSPAYREWLYHEFFNHHESIPGSRAFHALLHHLEAEARYGDHQRLLVWRRIGSRGQDPIPRQILLDLANPDCQFVEISPDSWQVTAGENALFQTSHPTGSLPAPIASDPAAALDTLRSCLNLPSRHAWLRCLGWLLAAFRPWGPYPVLILDGPPGAGKSLAARILRSLLDPCTSPLTPLPFTVSALLSLARHNWILAFDHVSALSPALTDALCRLSSGLGATLPRKRSDDSEPLQHWFRRPVILTVTGRWSCPAHLANRALTVTLPALPADSCQSELALVSTIREATAAILGALCSAVSTALARLPQLSPSHGPCPDALSWAVAAAPALGATEDEFRQAFASPPPPHPIVRAVETLLQQRRCWTGTATELRALLQPLSPSPPPEVLTRQLRNSALSLADAGIEIKFRRLHQGLRLIELRQDSPDPISFPHPQMPSPDSSESPQLPATQELNS